MLSLVPEEEMKGYNSPIQKKPQKQKPVRVSKAQGIWQKKLFKTRKLIFYPIGETSTKIIKSKSEAIKEKPVNIKPDIKQSEVKNKKQIKIKIIDAIELIDKGIKIELYEKRIP